MYIWRGYPLSVVAVDLLCRFLLSVFYIAGFHSRDQLPCFAAKTKKGTCIWKELDTLRTSLGHQHACRSFARARIWPPWRHDKTKKDDINGDKVTNLPIELWKTNSGARLARAVSSYPTTPNDHFCVRVYNVSSRQKLVNLLSNCMMLIRFEFQRSKSTFCESNHLQSSRNISPRTSSVLIKILYHLI